MGTRCCIRKCWDLETCTPVTSKAGNHLVAQKGRHEQHTQVQSKSGPQKREIKCRSVWRSLAAGASGEASWGGGMRAESVMPENLDMWGNTDWFVVSLIKYISKYF